MPGGRQQMARLLRWRRAKGWGAIARGGMLRSKDHRALSNKSVWEGRLVAGKPCQWLTRMNESAFSAEEWKM